MGKGKKEKKVVLPPLNTLEREREWRLGIFGKKKGIDSAAAAAAAAKGNLKESLVRLQFLFLSFFLYLF